MKSIVLVDSNQTWAGNFIKHFGEIYNIRLFQNPFKSFQSLQEDPADLIISRDTLPGLNGLNFLKKIRLAKDLQRIPFLLITDEPPYKLMRYAIDAGANDVYHSDTSLKKLEMRIKYLIHIKTNPVFHKIEQDIRIYKDLKRKIEPGFIKRTFDIVVSLSAILLLSPILLLTAIAIRLESEGKSIYISKRVGGGYKIFDLYKFRTMDNNADKALSSMGNQNQYQKDKKLPDMMETSDAELIHDNGTKLSEKEHLMEIYSKPTFNKIQKDPRVTKLGKFLRKTSIDELPQLFNILKGDISLVGNRPLPLYEAERLTIDEASQRFLAPAGLTGLWQVKQRGKDRVTEEERIRLDNYYAENRNLKLDLEIFFATFRAVIQDSEV